MPHTYSDQNPSLQQSKLESGCVRFAGWLQCYERKIIWSGNTDQKTRHSLTSVEITVHMVSSAAKVFLNPFKESDEFCPNVYYDSEKFPKQKVVFAEFQSLLHMNNMSLIGTISSRFLQTLGVCNRVWEHEDPLIVHYFSFLSPHDQCKCRWDGISLLLVYTITISLPFNILSIKFVRIIQKAWMNVLHQQLAKSAKGLTDTDNDRKTIICVLFTEFNKLATMIDLYRDIVFFFA